MSEAAYWTLEIGVLAFFLASCRHAWRRGARSLVELTSAVLYGFLLEQGDIALFGTYFYSSAFHLRIGFVPVSIGLTWAMIIYGAMLYSDRLGLPRYAAPFADALWALLIDLSADVVAIRLGLWQWNIPLNEGYFGVPAGNFYSWLTVALCFSAVTRYVRGRRLTLQFLAPFIAYPLFLLSLIPFVVVANLFYIDPDPHGSGIEITAATMALFILVVMRGLRRREITNIPLDFLPTFTRWSIHFYFLAALLWLDLHRQIPFLLLMAVVLISMEALLLLPPLLSRRVVLRRHGLVSAPVGPGVDPPELENDT